MAGGKVAVLVHPFFAEHIAWEKSFEPILRQDKTPVVILQEFNKIDDLKEKLSKIGAPDHLILPTLKASPSLRVKEGDVIELDEEHEMLSKMLSECGARTVLVGGVYGTSKSLSKTKRDAGLHIVLHPWAKVDGVVPQWQQIQERGIKSDKIVDIARRHPDYPDLVNKVSQLKVYEKLRLLISKQRRRLTRKLQLRAKTLPKQEHLAKKIIAINSALSCGCAGFTYLNLATSPHLKRVRVVPIPNAIKPGPLPEMELVKSLQLLHSLYKTPKKIPKAARRPFKPNH